VKRHEEAGSNSLELVLAAPLVLLFMMFIVSLGRMALASQDVDAAAHDAARAASLTRTSGTAKTAGTDAARLALGDRGMACRAMTVSIDVSSYRAGGQVRAEVTCTADLSDIALPGTPGRKVYRANAIVPIEQYRAE
jgi:Flp pilus assembly protein TadG